MVESVRAGGVNRPGPVGRDDTKTGETLFIVDGDATPMNQKARLSPAPAIGLDSLLALQAVDEGFERDRAAGKRGTALLASLTGLQRTMLGGEDPSLALRSLSELATGDLVAEDPELGAILRAIVLRSRIELARRQAPRQPDVELVTGT